MTKNEKAAPWARLCGCEFEGARCGRSCQEVRLRHLRVRYDRLREEPADDKRCVVLLAVLLLEVQHDLACVRPLGEERDKLTTVRNIRLAGGIEQAFAREAQPVTNAQLHLVELRYNGDGSSHLAPSERAFGVTFGTHVDAVVYPIRNDERIAQDRKICAAVLGEASYRRAGAAFLEPKRFLGHFGERAKHVRPRVAERKLGKPSGKRLSAEVDYVVFLAVTVEERGY